MSTATINEAVTKTAGSGARDRAKLKKAIRAVVVLTVLAAAGVLVWRYAFGGPAVPPNVIQVSGRIEGDDAVVASKTSGRIREISVREGDEVKAGQVIALLDDEQLRAKEEQAGSAVRQAEARVRWAEQQISVLEAELEQSRLGTDQAKLDAEGKVRQAEAQVAASEAQLAQAESEYRKARADEERYTSLAASGDVPEQKGSHARSAAEALEAAVRASRKQVDVSRAALTSARATLANPAIRSSEGVRIRQQMAQAQSDIAAARAEMGRAQAQLSEAQANRQDLQIVAPIDGTVATRSAEPGEVVSPGTPVVTLVNLSTVYLRGFVPEGQIGRVRTGQRAQVFLDSAPGQAIDAVVSRIDPEAAFTPENTYFRDDRVKQVVGVKIVLRGAVGYAKPGMPADGKVFVDSNETAANHK
ncbi:MAG TPA: HlyD family efflux transporter periplasmic adaptor subunit [Pyrinomonadaceae bacterium]|nr:HlyD family efflux transporter periplasmic adaptor subunit [Pyrinomonadaceae bacterium]